MAIDIDIVKKWAAEKYPFFMDNEDLLIRLYKKEVLKESFEEKRQYYPSFTTVDKLQENVPMSLRVKFLENGKRYSYMGCKVCHKKNCTDSSHVGTELVYLQNVDIGDETGLIPATVFLTGESLPLYEAGFLFLVKGKKVKDSRDGKDIFRISGWTPLSEDEGKAFNSLYDYIILHENQMEKTILADGVYNQWLEKQENKEMIKSFEKFLIVRRDEKFLYVNVW